MPDTDDSTSDGALGADIDEVIKTADTILKTGKAYGESKSETLASVIGAAIGLIIGAGCLVLITSAFGMALFVGLTALGFASGPMLLRARYGLIGKEMAVQEENVELQKNKAYLEKLKAQQQAEAVNTRLITERALQAESLLQEAETKARIAAAQAQEAEAKAKLAEATARESQFNREIEARFAQPQTDNPIINRLKPHDTT